jgi:hypothetical protein
MFNINENDPYASFASPTQISINKDENIINYIKDITISGIFKAVGRILQRNRLTNQFKFVKYNKNQDVCWWKSSIDIDDSHYGTEVVMGLQIFENDTTFNTSFYNAMKKSDLSAFLNDKDRESDPMALLDRLMDIDDVPIPLRIAFYIHRSDTNKYDELFEVRERVTRNNLDDFFDELIENYENHLMNWQTSYGSNPDFSYDDEFNDPDMPDFTGASEEDINKEIARIIKLAGGKKSDQDIDTDDDYDDDINPKNPKKLN